MDGEADRRHHQANENNVDSSVSRWSSITDSINPPLQKEMTNGKASARVSQATGPITSNCASSNMHDPESDLALSLKTKFSSSVGVLLHPARSAFLQRPNRRDGQTGTRSDSLLVHFKNEDREESPPADDPSSLARARPTPPSSSSNATTSSSSRCSHPELANLRPRPAARHRIFASQLKRNLRALETAFLEATESCRHGPDCCGDARPDQHNRLPDRAPPQQQGPPRDRSSANNHAYDADKEEDGEESSSSVSTPGHLKRSTAEMNGSDESPNRALGKRCRQSSSIAYAEKPSRMQGPVGASKPLTTFFQKQSETEA